MLSVKKLLYKICEHEKNQEIYYADKTFNGTFTIGSSGYVELGAPPSPITSGTNVLAIMISSWGGNSGAFAVARGGNNVAWLVGTPNVTVTNPIVRYAYFRATAGL